MSGPQDDVVGKAYDARLMRRLLVYLRPHLPMAAVAFVAIVGGASARVKQVAVEGVDRIEHHRRGAGAAEGGGDLAGDVAGLADAATNHSPYTICNPIDRQIETVVELFR